MLKDRRFWVLALPSLLLLFALLNPSVPLRKDSYNLIFVIDITQSMNARDYHVDGMPSDRLSFVKESLKELISALPCQSKVGLSLFTTKNSFLLFEPLEVCAHYAVIEESLMKIDWRMAWAADSHIARGLFTSLREVSEIDANPGLVFFTDGQQTPESAKDPRFMLKQGQVKGLLVGVGNLLPVPIPKYDQNNVQVGYWQIGEAERRLLKGRNESGEYLTSVQDQSLQRLAGITGLRYHHLETPAQLKRALQAADLRQRQLVRYEYGWVLALIALMIFSGPYLNVRRFNWKVFGRYRQGGKKAEELTTEN